ncbi:MAG: tryptophan--tRNA ligase [Actinomycetota bacterium]|nr:tryptophan--tRNA ligase [Actinomycetota bacterium]
MRQRYFSGIQPTGKLHIGNYLGAIKSWIELQDDYEGIFGIVDYHAITEPYSPKEMPKRIIDTALDYLAAGLDPAKSTLMVQSLVPEHTEMAWILNSITPVSWVERVPTYKEKARKLGVSVNMGLLGYPILMAADIVLYKSAVVPVGEDQLPHLELAREIVRAFNNRYGHTFPEPQAYVGVGARIMSLTEPTKKMSKSLGPRNYIALSDEPAVIRDKISKAVTDIGPGGGEMSPGTKNLFNLMSLFSTKETYQHFMRLYNERKIRYSDMKQKLADDIISALGPIRERRAALSLRPEYVKALLIEGSKDARKIAKQTLLEVKEKMGLLYFHEQLEEAA